MEVCDFWAKTSPFQSVVTHGLVSGYISQALFDYYLSPGIKKWLQTHLCLKEEEIKAFTGYLVSLHDIGKIEYCFQAKDPATKAAMESDDTVSKYLFEPFIRHEKTGQKSLWTIWDLLKEDEDSIDLFSAVIGAHHQGKQGTGHFKKNSSWFEFQRTFEEQMRLEFFPDPHFEMPPIPEHQQGSVGALFLGILILSDWIASGTFFANAEEWVGNKDAPQIIKEHAILFLTHSGLKPLHISWKSRFSDIWTNIPCDGIRPLQRVVEALSLSSPKPISAMLIEAPMGEGKTEAGVYAALQMEKQWKKDGLYFALPTAATSNQMVTRIRSLLQLHNHEAPVRLLHAMAWMEKCGIYSNESSEEADPVAKWLAPVRRGLLGQFAVGTVDQAMMAATSVKYGALRLLGLSNKVLVIDEIHSYDAYMNTIIKRLLEWCKALEIPVVMLSATLPPEKKSDLLSPFISQRLSNNYPLITAIFKDGSVIEEEVEKTTHQFQANVELLPILNNPEQIAERAIEEIQYGGCVCVLMNTVKEAQTVYSAIKLRYDDDLLLFHAQFTAERRAEIERQCIQRYGKDKSHRPTRSILVATQVVEQSLDVDFDIMLTAIAPIDLLIQRLGRVHRHEGSQRPTSHTIPSMTILTPETEGSFGSSSYVYPECLLKSSLRVFNNRDMIRVPEDIARIVQEGYDSSIVPSEELQSWIDNQIKEQVEAGASWQYLANPPDKTYNTLSDAILYDDESPVLSVATRLSEPTIQIALLPESQSDFLTPYLTVKNNGITYAEVWDEKVAEQIMLQRVKLNSNFRIAEGESGKSRNADILRVFKGAKMV